MPLKTSSDEQPAINLTSLIDVLFLLIMFFMAGTKFTEQERKLELRVPQVASTTALLSPPEKKVVNVFRDGQIALDHDKVSLEELTKRLIAAREQYTKLGVLVRGDGDGQFQRVAEVLNACKQAGIGDLGIAVRMTYPQR